ncbi:MAG: hypothetical protein ACHP7P_13335 [Terriglobales bacterium]
MAAISGLPSAHQVHQLCFAPIDVHGFGLRRGIGQLAQLLLDFVASGAERIPVVLAVLEQSLGPL